jgi:hypothetical protein
MSEESVQPDANPEEPIEDVDEELRRAGLDPKEIGERMAKAAAEASDTEDIIDQVMIEADGDTDCRRIARIAIKLAREVAAKWRE